MFKKILIFALVITTSISPFLPKVLATNGEWNPLIAQSVWDNGSYTVERLALTGTSAPQTIAGVTFVTNVAQSCLDPKTCTEIDLTILKDGKSLVVKDVNNQLITNQGKIAQNGQFVFYVKSKDKDHWFTAYTFDQSTNSIKELSTLDRRANEIKVTSFASNSDRIFTSLIQTDKKTGKVESVLSNKQIAKGYENRDFTWLLTAPWQEIEDVQYNWTLAKFEFSGGNKQLWLINDVEQKMFAIPETWTEPGSDIVDAHFLSDGTISYFKNFRLFTYDPTSNSNPASHGDAKLSWFVSEDKAVQIVGERMAWIDADNILYVQDANKIKKFGAIMNNAFSLQENTLSFENSKGFQDYSFMTNTFVTRSFLVTSRIDNTIVGIDSQKNVWYQNLSNNNLMKIGYGTNAVLSDSTHAYWIGIDGNVYEATMTPSVDVSKPVAQAFRIKTDATVYLVKDSSIWKITSPEVYMSWFDSWKNVQVVSPQVLAIYQKNNIDKGIAQFAPGTRVKAAGVARVYTVGNDGKLHWIVSETVAHKIYGSTWNKNILEIPEGMLWNYANGSDVTNELSIKNI